ncbi:MAG TPA: aldo/keto reductase [Candidatus Paceibacterota bacterium]
MQYKTMGRTGLRVSRLGLGTAEIGMPYGIGLRTVPTELQAIQLLRGAVDLGINLFDTAHIHQRADERIAKSGIAKLPGVIIATKCAHFLEKGEDPPRVELERRIRTEVEDNLRNLQVDSLTILQLHGGSRAQIKRGDLIEVLSKLKQEGKIQFSGISIRGELAAMAAVSCDFFDVVNIAYSILDQRLGDLFLPMALMENVGVINRSILLRGVLGDCAVDLPRELNLLKNNSLEANRIATELSMSLPSLAIRFALSKDFSISTSLIGTNKLEHLYEAVLAAEYGPLPDEVCLRLSELAISDPEQVDPALWPKF